MTQRAEVQEPSKSFWAMDGLEKLKFLGKVCVFLATGGFAFPTIFSPD